MSNILKVTTSLNGYENQNNVRTNPVGTPDSKIQGVVDPTKVVRPDARSDAGNEHTEDQQSGLQADYSSNFSQFIQLLRKNPPLMETFTKLFFQDMGSLVESGISENFAEEISQFMSMVQLTDEKDVLNFLKNQTDSSLKYKGAFFNLMRQILGESTSVELKARILDFMKRYTNMSSGEHIMENIRNNLTEIKQGMFRGPRAQLQEMEQQITYGDELVKGQTEKNATIIKEKILPYINEYITKTHDRSNLRDATARLAANVARYENGDASKLMDAFEKLLTFQGVKKYFKDFDPEILYQILERTDSEQAAGKNEWTKNFAELVSRAMKGEAGTESKTVFQNLMNSVLLNESVFMPVLHLMLPMEMDGTKMFSEIWADPDAEKSGKSEPSERTIKMLIKFEIQDLGFFDLYFIYRGGKMEMQLDYPEKLNVNEKEIRENLNQIMARNGISFASLVLEKGAASIPISEAFPQIYERRGTVNVKI